MGEATVPRRGDFAKASTPAANLGPDPVESGLTAAQAIEKARGLSRSAQVAEKAGRPSEAFGSTLAAWELVRSRDDAECRALAKALLVELNRLGDAANRDSRAGADLTGKVVISH